MNHQDTLMGSESPKKPRFLSIRAQVTDLRDVGATRIRRLAGKLSFDLAIQGLYTLNSKVFNSNRLGIFNWVALDGETHDYLLFPSLLRVLISQHYHSKWWYDVEAEETVDRS
jgi:hypothetical protein